MERNYIFDDLRINRNYDIAIASGIGRRESQQDSAYVASTDDDVIAVVCDGMGGIAGGQLASRTAVEAFLELYQRYIQLGISNSEWMQNAAAEVDDIVYSLTDSDGKRLGAGTTMLSVVVHDDQLNWLSIGDSRIYIFRKNEMAQVTNDHNYFFRLNQQKDDGEITAEQYHQEAHNGEALISFIGMGGLSLMDINEEPFRLYPGDVVLLCTDGLYRTVSDDEMKFVLNESADMQEAANHLDELITYRAFSFQDNYTYVLIKKL